MTALALMMPVAAGGVRAEEKVDVTLATDFVSSYYWRGQDLGDIVVQPTLGIGWKGLSLTAWGSVGLSDHTDTKEFDLTAAYQVQGFHVGVTDYWFNSPREKYFAYRNNNTSHVFEGNGCSLPLGWLRLDGQRGCGALCHHFLCQGRRFLCDQCGRQGEP